MTGKAAPTAAPHAEALALIRKATRSLGLAHVTLAHVALAKGDVAGTLAILADASSDLAAVAQRLLMDGRNRT